ncbi:MAG: TonB-dependent receptor [Paludibacter sp.]|nr:TonB-dependent receptor [Paludibacter sp.]
MRKLLLMLFIPLLTTFSLMAQTTAKGVVKVAGSGSPLSGVKITLLQQNISTQTNANGEFSLSFLEAGDDELSISKPGYFTQIKLVSIKANKANDFGVFELIADVQQELKQEVVMQLSESSLENEGNTQRGEGSFFSKNDVYLSQTSYSFSAMRFRTRGYDNKYESTYINGVHFVDAERGGFSYSSLGGLNNAFRNKDITYGYSPNTFAFGNLGNNTNITAKPSAFATGSHANVAFSNRSYKIRGQFTHSTGMLNNGWAFAVSGVIRWADSEGILKSNVDGSFYNSGGLFLSAEKKLNDNHSISLSAFGAPTRRAGQSAVTKETHDLVGGSVYYNPYWGYQNGKIRNSRIVETFDPTAILAHDWKISETQRLRTGVGFHHSWYSNSAFSYDGLNPGPEYYRNMPSFITDDEVAKDDLTNIWKTDDYNRQTKWDEIYRFNKENNESNPTGQARYILERRHNDLMETTMNSVYTNQVNKQLKLTAGVEARVSKGMHYVTIDDMLGANLYIDKDTYAERDLVGGTLQDADPRIIENDINDPNKSKTVGDIIRYNYDMNVTTANAFAQAEWSVSQLSVYAGAKATYTQFYRFGNMENGRAWYLREKLGKNVNSYGKSQTWYFTDPSLKAGFTYNIDNKSHIVANVLAETRAPLVQDAYVSERIKDVLVKNLTSEKILAYDLNYSFNYKTIRGRVGGFRTHVIDAGEKLGYYDDEYRTFINHLLSNVNKIYQGVELGVSVPVNSMFTLSAAGTYADYSYTSDATGIKSYENGAVDDITEKVLTNGLKISSGPQLAANVTIDFFYDMWFADVTLNYYDNNYLDFAPNRFTVNNQQTLKNDPELYEKLGKQEKLQGGFMLDASVGKLIYLKNRNSLNFNLSVSNVLNNTSMITGGYQQARIPMSSGAINPKGADWFLNKYYYAWGVNLFFHVGYKF